VTYAEVMGKMQAISDPAEERMEYSDDPDVKAFREARRRLKGFEPPTTEQE
jgi:hypothetical protein